MYYKLCAIDLDHTLLNSRGKITKKSYDALYNYVVSGGEIFLCTGRWPNSAFYFNHLIEKNNQRKNKYLVALNGAIVYNLSLNKIIYANIIPDDYVKLFFDIQKKFKATLWIYSLYGIENKIIYSTRFFLKWIVQKFNFGKIKFINKKKYTYKNDVLKIIFMSFSKKKVNLIYDYVINNCHQNEIECVKTSSYLLEITLKGSNKGRAVEIISKDANVSLNEFVAFGDSNNDITMFEKVGLKIAINSSSEKLRSLATYNCDVKKEAFAYGLNNYLMKNKMNIKYNIKSLLIDLSNVYPGYINLANKISLTFLENIINHGLNIVIFTNTTLNKTILVSKSLSFEHLQLYPLLGNIVYSLSDNKYLYKNTINNLLIFKIIEILSNNQNITIMLYNETSDVYYYSNDKNFTFDNLNDNTINFVKISKENIHENQFFLIKIIYNDFNKIFNQLHDINSINIVNYDNNLYIENNDEQKYEKYRFFLNMNETEKFYAILNTNLSNLFDNVYLLEKSSDVFEQVEIALEKNIFNN